MNLPRSCHANPLANVKYPQRPLKQRLATGVAAAHIAAMEEGQNTHVLTGSQIALVRVMLWYTPVPSLSHVATYQWLTVCLPSSDENLILFGRNLSHRLNSFWAV